MKKRCLILIVILIAGLLLSVSACAEARPPEGKEEGSATDIYEWNLTSDYLYNYENETSVGWAWNTDLRPLDSSDESAPEPAESVKVTQTAGDSSLEGAFSAEYYDDGTFYKNGYWLVYHPTAVKTDGEASYRVELSSEHYWCTVEFTARFMNRGDISVTPAEEVIDCNVGEQISLTEEDVQRIVQANPAVAIASYYLLSPETGEAITETDGYELDWSRFTAKAPGDHSLKLFAVLGRNEAITVEAPITMHVISREEADDLWDAAWPPEGKTEGKRTGTNTRRNWNATFFINDDESKPWSSLAPFSLSPDGSGTEQEEITEYHVTFLSGDEHLRGLFYNGQYTEGHAAINMNWRNITEPGTAEFRIDMVSEHYYASEIARPVVVDAKAIKVELLSGDVNVTLGQEVDLAKLYESRAFVVVEPQYEYSCSVSGEEGEIPEETEDYTFSRGVFTAKQAGDYPMVLRVSVGSSGLSKAFPIVIHASADTAEAAVTGDAAISINAMQEAQSRLERKKDPEDILTSTENAYFLYRKKDKRSSKLLSKYDRQKENQEDEYVITGIYPLYDTLIIPTSLDENPIVGVERRAISFGGQDNVRSLRIEEGIRSVDGLSNMKNLKEVFLPDSLEKIEMGAFSGDCSLTEIRIPDSITLEDIEQNAFYGIGAENLVLGDGTDLMATSAAAYRAEGKNARGIVFACNWNNFVYLVREDGGAMILDYSGSLPEEGRLVIPEAINGHLVREIGESAFSYQAKLTALILPEGLESIGEKAFFECESLAEVQLPSTLEDVGDQAFMGVAADQIDLPESVLTVSAGWFGGPEKTDVTGKWTYRIMSDGTAVLTDYQYTKKMVFPAEVDGIPVTEIDEAKYSQESSEQKGEVTQVSVPEGVKIIGEETFINMYKLTKVSLPKGLEQIGRLAFCNCHTMTSITIPEGVTVIGERAFDLCLKLKSVKLPSTLQEIRTEAFSSCPLSSVKLPDSLRVIGDRAFYNHKASEWTIPAGVESVGDEALLPQFVAQKKITFLGADTMIGNALFGGDENGSWYRDVSSSLYNGLSVTCYPGSTADRWFRSSVKKTYLKWGPEGVRTAPADRVLSAGLFRPDEKVYELTIPEGVEEITDGAFDGLSSLYKVTLPSTLKAIGNRAFADCVGLTEITLPKSLTFIGEECFRNCYSLKKISIPEGVRIIPAYAFAGCESLSDLKLAEGLEEIGVHAFEQDTKAVQNQYWWARGNPTVTSLKTLKLPASLKTIGEYAFVSCDALTSVSFAKASQLTEIGKQAFAMCVLLKDITLPDSVQRVGSAAFVNCLNLKKADLGKGVTGVGEELFLQCMNLMSLKVPESLTDIGGKLLDGCPVKLVVTCPAGSAMDAYMQKHYPDLKVIRK